MGQIGIGALGDHSRVDEGCAGQLAPDREPRFDASFQHEVSTQGSRLEIAVLEISGGRIALRDVGAAGARDVERIVRLQRRDRNGEHARSELILTIAAHGLRAAGVEAFARVQHDITDASRNADGLRSTAKRTNPPRAQVRGKGAALANLVVR